MSEVNDLGDGHALLELTLNNGRDLWCYQYFTSHTYVNFDERTPSEMCNQHVLEKSTPNWVKKIFGDWPYLIIPPARTPGKIDLPRVRFMAFFESLPVDRNNGIESSLVVVWFQETASVAIDARNLELIRAMEWEKLAVDY